MGIDKALDLGGGWFLDKIIVGRMWSGLERLLEEMWFVGFGVTTTTFFIDIGQVKLAVFCINRFK